ncbi:MAG: hypothetical protein JRI25_00310 [Deltaproteobacteria bacterium]|nr:hypothetical protein [Deltaproteobacteria bacterium]MBW2253020.1 hypothetical protein [Deltaproteobacteria bacterium]
MRPNMYVWVETEGGTELQYLAFHASCSEPLFVGYQFGSILIMGFINSE